MLKVNYTNQIWLGVQNFVATELKQVLSFYKSDFAKIQNDVSADVAQRIHWGGRNSAVVQRIQILQGIPTHLIQPWALINIDLLQWVLDRIFLGCR